MSVNMLVNIPVNLLAGMRWKLTCIPAGIFAGILTGILADTLPGIPAGILASNLKFTAPGILAGRCGTPSESNTHMHTNCT